MTKQPDFLHVNANSWKLNADWKILGACVRDGCGHSVLKNGYNHSSHRALKLALSREGVNEIN